MKIGLKTKLKEKKISEFSKFEPGQQVINQSVLGNFAFVPATQQLKA